MKPGLLVVLFFSFVAVRAEKFHFQLDLSDPYAVLGTHTPTHIIAQPEFRDRPPEFQKPEPPKKFNAREELLDPVLDQFHLGSFARNEFVKSLKISGGEVKFKTRLTPESRSRIMHYIQMGVGYVFDWMRFRW